jgi:superfamily II DNA/RNA helicase
VAVVAAAAVAAAAAEAVAAMAVTGVTEASLTETRSMNGGVSDNSDQPETTFGGLGLPADIIEVLTDQGITVPTPIQALTIPDGLAGRDVCGRAETGSGKTLAFGLPIIVRLDGESSPNPRALILVPTRELAAQVTEALEPAATVRGLRLVAVYGGVPMQPQISAAKAGADIVVATPGRLLDIHRRGILRLDAVRHVVIDEADQMADMGFLPQVHDVLRAIPRGHQTMLFSATLDGQVRTLVREYMTEPAIHTIESRGDLVETQEHRFVGVHHMDKAKVAAAIINSSKRCLVFVQTKRAADRVARELADEGINVAKTHGDLQQQVRERNLERFSQGKVQALVATNVAARGLHIDDVDVVIHYDPPDDFKTFVHRSGRTARAGEEGLVVTLVEWDEILDVERLQRSAGLNTEIVKMYSNDPRLTDLATFEPDSVVFKRKSVADLSRRAGRRRGRRR